MAIDVTAETILTLPQAARRLGKHRDTLRNWITHGRGGVRLEAVTLPGGLHTSTEALARFVGALTGRQSPELASPAAVERGRRAAQSADERAAAELEKWLR